MAWMTPTTVIAPPTKPIQAIPGPETTAPPIAVPGPIPKLNRPEKSDMATADESAGVYLMSWPETQR